MKKQSFWQKLFGMQPVPEVTDKWVGKEEPPLKEASAAKREQTRRTAYALRAQQRAEMGYDPTVNALFLAQQFSNDGAPETSSTPSHHTPSHHTPSHTPTQHSDHNSWSGGHHSGGHDFGGGHSGGFDGGGGGFSGGDGGGGSF